MGGKSSTLTCPECGTTCTSGVRYCANCAASLSGLEAGPSSEPYPAGTIIGSYRLLDVLGEGGMGRVYLGEHVKLGRRVAIKILRAEFASSPVALSRFFAEARAVNQISHENIVEITDFLEKPGGDSCYVMELLKGKDLGRKLLEQQRIPIATTVDVGIQIASALAAVHKAGIVHRDLKPDNIFLAERRDRPDLVKLLDFGVAKLSGAANHVATHTTAAGTIIGTPEYMSPEQAAGTVVDHRTDIYALGVIFYELVTGVLPFRAKSFGELVIKHMTVAPQRPTAHLGLQHEIPPALELLILDLLAKDPDHRPQSMTEVEQRLREIHEGLDAPVPRAWLPSGSMPIARIETESEPLRTIETPPVAHKRPALRWLALGVAVPAIGVVAYLMLRTPGAEAVPAPPPPASPPVVKQVEPAPPPSPPPVVAKVTVRFSSTPSGAVVRIAGAKDPIGTTPFEAAFPRSQQTIELEVEKPGYAVATERFELAADRDVASKLTKLPPVAHRRPTKPAKPPKPRRDLDRGGTMNVFDR